jgi:RNA polymerase sigma factor (sigma-70 family)
MGQEVSLGDLADLVQKASRHDRQAMEELIARFQGMAVNYAWSLTGDCSLAEDLAQEAFIKVLTSLGSLKNAEAFPKWFKTILYYTCVRALQNGARLPISLDDDERCLLAARDSAHAPEERLLEHEERLQLWQAIDTLNETDRAILALFYGDNCTHRQISDFLGLPETKVNNRLYALRAKLRKEMTTTMPESAARARFAGKVIAGVQKLEQMPASGETMFTYFCGSLKVLLDAAGVEPHLDYAHIVTTSGAALRMIWKKGFHFENEAFNAAHNDPFMLVRWGLEACGCQWALRLNATFAGDYPGTATAGVTLVDEDTARKDICRSIDRGMPVLAIGVVGPPEFCVVTGYDDDGRTLMGWNYWQNEVTEPDLVTDSGGYFRKGNWYQNTRGYVLITRIRPVVLDKEYCKVVLQRAVELERTYDVHGHAAGLEAFRAWADQLLSDDEFVEGSDAERASGVSLNDKFIVYLDNHCVLNERAKAASFLERMGAAVPEWAERLGEAARYYRKAAEFSGAMWQYVAFGEEGLYKFRNPDTRAILAGHILKARMWEEKAVACIERLLAE